MLQGLRSRLRSSSARARAANGWPVRDRHLIDTRKAVLDRAPSAGSFAVNESAGAMRDHHSRFHWPLAGCGQGARDPPAPPTCRPRPRRPSRRRRSTTTGSSHTYPHDPPGLYPGPVLPRRPALREHRPGRPLDHPPGQSARTAACCSRCRIPPGQFGEGIVDWGDADRLASPGPSGIGYRWDRRTLRRLGEWRYRRRRLGPHPERPRHHHERRHRRAALPRSRRPWPSGGGCRSPSTASRSTRLNELEWVNGEIFANVWLTAASSPGSTRRAAGSPAGSTSRRSPPRTAPTSDNVLNGIAYDAAARPPVRHRQELAAPLRDRPRSAPLTHR